MPDGRNGTLFGNPAHSGVRAVIVASLLQRAGRKNARVVLGGIAGWNSTSCPLPLG